MQRPSFLGEEKSLKKTSLTKEVTFLKNCCFLLIFSDQDNIAKLVVGEEIFLTDFVNYCSIQINMIFKSSYSQMFYKISVSKNSAKFTWKHLRLVTLLQNLRPFTPETFYETPPDNYFCVFSFILLLFVTHWTNKNQVFSIFEEVLSQLLNVINIMNFEFGKLCKTKT